MLEGDSEVIQLPISQIIRDCVWIAAPVYVDVLLAESSGDTTPIMIYPRPRRT